MNYLFYFDLLRKLYTYNAYKCISIYKTGMGNNKSAGGLERNPGLGYNIRRLQLLNPNPYPNGSVPNRDSLNLLMMVLGMTRPGREPTIFRMR